MAKQIILTGTTPNDRNGDPLRTAFTKVNQNFTELYDSRTYLPPELTLTINNTSDTTPEDSGALHVLGGGTVEKSFTVNEMLHVGNGAVNNQFVSPAIVAKRAGSTYAQIALINSDGHGSADFAAYADNGTEEGGWVDMGVTGSVFSDMNYTITEEGEGYIFVQGIDDGISHGSLVLCTGSQGTEKNIIFGTGGFMHENARMELKHAEQCLEVMMDTNATPELNGALWLYGGARIDKNLVVNGEMYVGQDANVNTLENTIFAAKKSSDTYITFGVINSNNNGSADLVAQANGGTAEYGWVDVGFTGRTFADPNYTITGPGDAYLFASGFPENSSGNLVLSTSTYGSVKDIVFGTGGFTAENIKMRLHHENGQLHLMSTQEATGITSGALRVDGGAAINKSLNVGGKYIGSTVYKSGGTPSERVALDLTKQIQKLAAGVYSLANGEEGQVLRVVRQTGVSNATECRIYVAKSRIAGTEYTDNFIDPFVNGNDITTFIFTDGAWQAQGGLWD